MKAKIFVQQEWTTLNPLTSTHAVSILVPSTEGRQIYELTFASFVLLVKTLPRLDVQLVEVDPK